MTEPLDGEIVDPITAYMKFREPSYRIKERIDG